MSCCWPRNMPNSFDILVTAQKSRRSVFVDFETLANVTDVLNATAAGTGASATVGVAATGGEIGVRAFQTGTTATGRASALTNSDAIRHGNGEAATEWEVLLPVLSDGTEEYLVRFGFLDSVIGPPVDGAWWEYDRAAFGPNWQLVTSSLSTTTRVDSGVAVNTTNHRLKVVMNATATSASFSLDDATVSTPITTNLPAGRLGGLGATIIKSVGTTSREWRSDYMWFDVMSGRS